MTRAGGSSYKNTKQRIWIEQRMQAEHKCDQPVNRSCWDCGFCGHRKGCTEPVDGYGNPINVK